MVEVKIIYGINFILCLAGAILVLVGDFACYISYYTYCIHIETEYGAILGVMGFFLIMCAGLSILGIVKPEMIKEGQIKLGILFSLLTLLLVLVGIGISAALLTEADWWPGEGFYGSFIASVISLISFLLVNKESK